MKKASLFVTQRAHLYLLSPFSFITCILAVPLFILLDSIADLDAIIDVSVSAYYYYFCSLTFGALFGPYLIPMLCTLPCAVFFCEERSSGLWRNSLARSSWKNYFISRFIISTLSGGLVFALGVLLIFGGLCLRLPLFSADDLSFFETFYYGRIALSHPVLYVFIAAAYSFFSGCIYAAFATAVSAFTPSRSAVVAAPFVLSFIWVRIAVLANLPAQCRLDQWLTMRLTFDGQIGSEIMTFLLCSLLTLAIVLACGVVFCRQGKKVLLNE